MPQDKRLLITKAVVLKLQRVSEAVQKDPSKEGIFIFFTLPTVVLAQCPDIMNHLFPLPHKVFPKDGRTTCLIVPKVITTDCFKINKRHGYVDAVVTAESICRRQDVESSQRAERVAATFRHFLVDSRILNKLPLAITESVKKIPRKKTSSGSDKGGAATASGSGDSITGPSCPTSFISPVEGLENTESLAVRLSQAASSGVLRSLGQGQLIFRVGHGGMTAGDICENAKCFVFAIKKDFPTVFKYVYEFKMTSNQTDAIRFMEAQIQR